MSQPKPASPRHGLAGFVEADNFVLGEIRKTRKGGIKASAKIYPIDIRVRDSQSDPNRAAQVAQDLIKKDNVDIMLIASTPETTNPVADPCEVNSVPCISSVAPWQPYLFGRKGDPGVTPLSGVGLGTRLLGLWTGCPSFADCVALEEAGRGGAAFARRAAEYAARRGLLRPYPLARGVRHRGVHVLYDLGLCFWCKRDPARCQCHDCRVCGWPVGVCGWPVGVCGWPVGVCGCLYRPPILYALSNRLLHDWAPMGVVVLVPGAPSDSGARH